ncbi:MAG: class I SAM-dependent methyltransferase [Gammaproteobacteria bacterium]|nr:class I SAM-dependent methyltransferase [Gammaproteobacteria bacterium]
MDRKKHWEQIYSDKKSTEVSWYQQHPERSLELIKATGVDVSARIIDIGGGASTLVDFLLDAGYHKLAVLDLSHAAIEQAKFRLGNRMNKVEWFEQDVTLFTADKPFDVWHDRAVFHFLTDTLDRSSYIHTMCRVLNPGAHVIIATFDLNGPEKCSGLEIKRYSPETMSATLGDSFQLVETSTEEHKTPGGSLQSFIYCRFIRV